MKRHLAPWEAMPVVTEELRHAMMTYYWPGNIRELENFIRRLIILRDPALLARELNIRASRQPFASTSSSEGHTVVTGDETPSPILEQVNRAKQMAEVDAIVAALNSTRWNRKRGAAMLNIDYKAMLYKMKRLGIGEKYARAAQRPELLPNAAMAAAGKL